MAAIRKSDDGAPATAAATSTVTKATSTERATAAKPKAAPRAKPDAGPTKTAPARPAADAKPKAAAKAAPKRKPAATADAPSPAIVALPPPSSGGVDVNLVADLIAWARDAGADAADAIVVEGTQLSIGQRLGKREKLERSEGRDLGLRAFVGKRQAFVSTTDFTVAGLKALARRAVDMARVVPEDPWCGIAEPSQLAKKWPELDLDDGLEPTAELLLDWTARAEAVAMAVEGVTNSEGADAAWGRTRVAFAASNGFAGAYSRGGYSLSCSVLAGEGTGMERDYDWTSAVHQADLESPDAIGRSAGEGAVNRLNSKRPKSGRVPVVFDQRVSGGIVGHLAGAINGRSIARGTSFLKDSLGKAVFAAGISVIDDPHRRRGSGSMPFDAEGLACHRRELIADGKLTTWVLDLASARQLGLQSTGNASRGTSGPPGPTTTNLYMAPGKLSVKDLIGDIESGLYVTDLIGFGVNGVTGDYSRGASGFWIEKGELAWAVNGLTIAGNLKDMFRELTPADDLVFKSDTNAPTLRIDGMTIAGE